MIGWSDDLNLLINVFADVISVLICLLLSSLICALRPKDQSALFWSLRNSELHPLHPKVVTVFLGYHAPGLLHMGECTPITTVANRHQQPLMLRSDWSRDDKSSEITFERFQSDSTFWRFEGLKCRVVAWYSLDVLFIFMHIPSCPLHLLVISHSFPFTSHSFQFISYCAVPLISFHLSWTMYPSSKENYGFSD